MEELNKVFDVMHVVGSERVELVAYQLKSVSRTWFDQWKDGRAEDAPHPSCACFKEAFFGRLHYIQVALASKKPSSEDSFLMN